MITYWEHIGHNKYPTPPPSPKREPEAFSFKQSLCGKLILEFDVPPIIVLCPFFHFQIIFNFSRWVDFSYPHHLNIPLSIEFLIYVP
jgi:hypothetical protein